MAVAAAVTRSDVAEQLRSARRETEHLFAVLKPERLYDRPIAERHRVIFYLGHLDAFDYIQICREGLGMRSDEPELDSLFQAGIDPDSEHLPSDTPADWPSVEQIRRYVAQARKAVDESLAAAPAAAVHMALEHRLMHLETLAYMWHNFDFEAKIAPADGSLGPTNGTRPVANPFLPVSGGYTQLGKERDDRFGWDNEYDLHQVRVEPFRIQRYKVSNGEYLEFVRDGGPKPHFWVERGGRMYYRGMFHEYELPLTWPVYVTQKQAAAYAAWAGRSLPTEAQFHRAAFGTTSGQERQYPWGDERPSPEHGNFDFRRWDPEPVDSTPFGGSAFGMQQMAGNGWEWTASVFVPFEGFRPEPSYPGYSANFFDGEHYVMKGGSPRTAARLLRRSFRNWFRADYSYVYASFRCVEA